MQLPQLPGRASRTITGRVDRQMSPKMFLASGEVGKTANFLSNYFHFFALFIRADRLKRDVRSNMKGIGSRQSGPYIYSRLCWAISRSSVALLLGYLVGLGDKQSFKSITRRNWMTKDCHGKTCVAKRECDCVHRILGFTVERRPIRDSISDPPLSGSNRQ